MYNALFRIDKVVSFFLIPSAQAKLIFFASSNLVVQLALREWQQLLLYQQHNYS